MLHQIKIFQLLFLATLWAPSPYFTVVLIGTINLISSCLCLIDTKGVDLDVAADIDERTAEQQLSMTPTFDS